MSSATSCTSHSLPPTNREPRPAVVISSDAHHRDRLDLVVLAITSQVKATADAGEVRLTGWKEAGLLKPSVVKPVLATIERRLVLRKLGRLEGADRETLQGAIRTLFGV